MSAHELRQLYHEWRHTSCAERRAIMAGSWQEMNELQQQKNELKHRITQTTDQWRQSWSITGETAAEFEQQFRPVVDELISLEAGNLSLLASRRTELQQQLEAANRTVATLRGVHQSYGDMRVTSAWVSYS